MNNSSEQSARCDGIDGNKNEDDASELAAKPPSQTKLKEAGDAGGGGGDDYEAWLKSRQLLRPDDALDLTETDLAEEVSKVMMVVNTNAIENLVIYNFSKGAYVLIPPIGGIITLFQFDGTALHIDSPEAQAQIDEMGEDAFIMPQLEEGPQKGAQKKETKRPSKDAEAEGDEEGQEKVEDEGGEEEGEGGEEGDEGEDEGEEGEGGGAAVEAAPEPEKPAAAAPPATGGRKKKLINQFNFCERAALTLTNPFRAVETQTIPPPRSTYGNTVLQWVIYDSYLEDFASQTKEDKGKGKAKPKSHDNKKKNEKALQAEEMNKKYLKCWQILERMINQNIFDDIAQDYRYWEDPADDYRDGEGTLLPLWKFSYEKTKKMNVTDLLFNPHYYDLYAACFGSYDFMKQTSEGSVCLFTIKNPSFPDYRIMCESGVMCCDIHPKYPFLLAIGMYDGNVAVYNLQESVKDPLYISQGVNGKHAECVWEIKWGPDMPDGEINFYSVSTDGRVFNWVLMQNKLAITTIITLFIENGIVEGPDGTEIKLKGCGTCMTFHPEKHELFLVGTEEGRIYKCSTAYSSKYLMTYDAHYLSVYRIDYNKFNSNIFASCSGDWRVKIWEDMRQDPLFIFDLGSCVGDVRWAPYSSTVFAAVTSEGKVFVFDLNVNKYKAICIQAVVPKRKNKLTRLAFNQKLPFIIVGDDKGTTTSLKLSPNLRVMAKPPKKQPWLDQYTLQVQKLDKLLSLVRELPEGATGLSAATTEAS